MDKGAQENKLVVGSQARILYADAEGRVKLPKHF
jgi:urocanate hydratase